MFVFKTHKTTGVREFLNYWSNIYSYPKEEYYEFIDAEQLNGDQLRNLFDWKNGFAINGNRTKAPTVEKLVDKLKVINHLKKCQTVINIHEHQDFIQHFDEISPIWKIFLLHVINNKRYPIFDQHVYRAYMFLTAGEENASLPAYPPKVFAIYTDKYLPFFNEYVEQTKLTKREIDKALWAFGKFLKSDFKKQLSPLGEPEG